MSAHELGCRFPVNDCTCRPAYPTAVVPRITPPPGPGEGFTSHYSDDRPANVKEALKAALFRSDAEVDAIRKAMPEGAVGDINSTAKGSGARFNAGKPPMELIPLQLIAESLNRFDPKWSEAQRTAIWSLAALGAWQEEGDTKHLYTVLRNLGLSEGWRECAQVFDYGKRKYAEWNWAKGMAWSIVMACAARHLMQIIDGEQDDSESGLPHRGHVFCNIVMLLTFIRTFPEGDDRPRCLA